METKITAKSFEKMLADKLFSEFAIEDVYKRQLFPGSLNAHARVDPMGASAQQLQHAAGILFIPGFSQHLPIHVHHRDVYKRQVLHECVFGRSFGQPRRLRRSLPSAFQRR